MAFDPNSLGSQGYPPLQEPLVDLRTGLITRPWGLFNQTVNQYISVLQNITQILPGGQVALAAPSSALPLVITALARAAWRLDGSTVLLTDIAGTVHNFTPTGTPPYPEITLLELNAQGGIARLTGMKASNFTQTQIVLVLNVGSYDIQFGQESQESEPVNRFVFPDSAVVDGVFSLPRNSVMALMWRKTTGIERWFAWGAFRYTVSVTPPGPGDFAKDWFASRLHNRSGGVLGIGEPAPTLAGVGSDDTQTTGLFRNLATGAVIGADASVISGGSSQVSPLHDPTWEILIRTGPNLNAQRLWVLFSNVNATDVDDLGGAGQYLGFRRSTVAGDGGFVGVSRDGSTQSVTGTIALAAVSTTYRLKVRKDGSTLYFSVNGGTEIAKTTNLPAATAELFWFVRIFTTEAVAKSFSWGRQWLKYGIAA